MPQSSGLLGCFHSFSSDNSSQNTNSSHMTFKDIARFTLFLLLTHLSCYWKQSSQYEQASSFYGLQQPGLAQSTSEDWLEAHQSAVKCDGQFTEQPNATSCKHYMKSHSGLHSPNQAKVISLHDQELSAQKQVLHRNSTATHYENLKEHDDRTENQKQNKLVLERSYPDSLYIYRM